MPRIIQVLRSDGIKSSLSGGWGGWGRFAIFTRKLERLIPVWPKVIRSSFYNFHPAQVFVDFFRRTGKL